MEAAIPIMPIALSPEKGFFKSSNEILTAIKATAITIKTLIKTFIINQFQRAKIPNPFVTEIVL